VPHAIRFHETGGPEVLQWEQVTVGDPGPGQVRIRHRAAGLNFIDVYHRTGVYQVPLPSGIGVEGAGLVEAVGEGVNDLQAGDRVAYAGGAPGSYSEVRLMPADRLVPLPPSISLEQGAAVMLKGLTAQYLLRSTYRVKAGDTILVHAAAGGVGLIMCQWARLLGATVIGTASTDAKAELARAHGCHHTIVTSRERFVDRVKAITGGEGLPVVYDSVGRETFMDSLACLRPRGLMVSFGNASGVVPPFEIGTLSRMGSLFLTRPTLFGYIARREELLANASELFEAVAGGHVEIAINQTYPLVEAAQAHRDLEARRTTGSTVLIP